MKIKSLTSTLISLGVHVGHLRNVTLSSNFNYILGTKYDIDVIDIKHTLLSLKRANNFMFQLGQLKGDLLFHCTSLFEYSYNIRFFFVHLINVKYKQRIFDEKWVFGQLGNFKNNALYMLYKLFFIRNSKLPFYSRTGYKRMFYFRYKVQKIRNQRLRKRKQIESRGFRMSKLNNIHFFDLFIRVIFYSYFRKIEGLSFELHSKLMLKYFKFVLVFKYFRTFLVMPDVFILVNNKNIPSPVLEILNYKIPIIGLLDSNSNPFGITYPIYSNDDSILLSIFYFKLFLKMYTWGKMKRFM